MAQPRSTHHKKLTRKQLKQPDEFLTFIDDAREFLTQNLNQVLISAGVVAAAIAIVTATYYYERHRDTIASDRFYSAMSLLGEKRYKDAEDAFSKLAAAEPRREVGRLARFYSATAYLEENDLPHARDALIAYLAESRDPTFTNLALADLGVVYERMGEYKKAEG